LRGGEQKRWSDLYPLVQAARGGEGKDTGRGNTNCSKHVDLKGKGRRVRGERQHLDHQHLGELVRNTMKKRGGGGLGEVGKKERGRVEKKSSKGGWGGFAGWAPTPKGEEPGRVPGAESVSPIKKKVAGCRESLKVKGAIEETGGLISSTKVW